MTEQDIDLAVLDSEEEDKARQIKGRINQLSEKLRMSSEEKEELAKAKDALELEKTSALKERDFYASFADATAKYPDASSYKDAIKEKVMAGYTVEDATISTLAKEGKLTGAPQQQVEREVVAGGSATNPPSQGGAKPINEMSREELRQALVDAEQRGDIGIQ